LSNLLGEEINEVNEGIVIPLSEPFDMNTNLGYLKRSTNECMFKVENDAIRRVIVIGKTRTLVQIEYSDNKQLNVHFIGGAQPTKTWQCAEIVNYIREWFDLDNDLFPFYEMANADPLLKTTIKEFYGLRLIGIPDLFEALCWGVLGQQINLGFAYTLKRQFVEKFGESIESDGKNYWIFPSYEQIAQLTPNDFADIKMTVKKSEYIIGIAKLMASGELSKQKLIEAGSFKEVEKSLIKIRGIGPWTANYVLMRCLRFPNAFPIEDVGLINAIKTLLKMDRKPTKEEILALSIPWDKWESYATFYLWRVLY
jgi:DNA-3-methyladenine glycosylase II